MGQVVELMTFWRMHKDFKDHRKYKDYHLATGKICAIWRQYITKVFVITGFNEKGCTGFFDTLVSNGPVLFPLAKKSADILEFRPRRPMLR